MPLHHLTIYTHHSLELAGKTSDKQHKSYASSKTNRGIGFSDIQEYLGTFKIEHLINYVFLSHIKTGFV